MSQGFGPYSVTAGTIQSVGIDPNSAAVFIQNDTPYYLFVSFNPTQPSPSTILNQDWPASIKPFDSQTEYITGNAQLVTPQGSMTFQGKVWLLPVDLRNVGLAQNGTVSSAALVSVRSFLLGEEPPVAYSSSRQTDVTSQTRVIALPPSGAAVTGLWQPTGTGQAITLATYAPTGFTIAPIFAGYVYSFLFTPWPSAVGVGTTLYQLSWQPMQGPSKSQTPLGPPFPAATASVITSGTGGGTGMISSWPGPPIYTAISPAAQLMTAVQLQLTILGFNSSIVQVAYVVSSDVAAHQTQGIPCPGGQLVQTFSNVNIPW